MARIDGHFEANLEVKTRLFVCWLIGLWAVLLTCVAVSETFSGLSITLAVMSQALSHYIFQNGSTPPFESHCLAEIMLWPSGGMPLTRTVFFNISMARSSPLGLLGQNAGFSAHHFVQSLVQVTTSLQNLYQ